MTLDTVTTIAIGDIDASGSPLHPDAWNRVRTAVAARSDAHGTVVATAHGAGITSDQPDELSEQTFVVIVINVDDLTSLRESVADALRRYGLSSACFATDHAHEPAFATPNGYRPVVTSAAYAPAHGGYCG